jgi:acetyl-CoA carboxylase carboxyl transferase subunit beta
MQEGTLALMQLAKTVAALERLRAGRVPFVSVMSDPTTGGVFASFAVLGDVNIAEPNALIGFAGARVAASTIAQELPPGFQRSEFLFEHGFVDRIVPRAALRHELAGLLRYLVPASITVPGEATDALNLPAFRPLSFLSALADRMIPDLDLEPGSDGRGAGASGAAASGNGHAPDEDRSTHAATPAPAAAAPLADPAPGDAAPAPAPSASPAPTPVAAGADGREDSRG